MEDQSDNRDDARNDAARDVLVVHPTGHAVALAVVDRLKEAGCTVTPLPSIYDAVIRLAREPGHFAAVVLAVDFCNRDELQFFPMAARRWPGLPVAAVAQPAFAYKTAMADLLGARSVCSDPGQAEEFVRRLNLGAERITQTVTVTVTATGEAVVTPEPAAAATVAPEANEVILEPRKTGTSLPITSLPTKPVERAAPAATPPAAPTLRIAASGEDEFPEEHRQAGLARPPRQPHVVVGGIRAAEAEPVVPSRRPPVMQSRAARTDSRDVLTQEELSALMADLGDDEGEGDRD